MTSSYSAEFCTDWLATEESISMQFMLRYFGVPMKIPTSRCGNNLGMIISSTNLDLKMIKKHMEISYHKLQESAAARVVNQIKV